MSIPVYEAHTGNFIKQIDLPHIYSEEWLSGYGYNGRPALVQIPIQPKLNVRSRRTGGRSTDNCDPRFLPPKAEVYVYLVDLLMPTGHSHSIRIGVTMDRKLVEQLPTTPNPEA